MRIKFWDRLVIAFSGLLVLLAGLGLFVFGIGVFPFTFNLSVLGGTFELWQRAVMVVIALLLCGIGIYGVWMLFRRGGKKGFIIQHTEFGDMSISMHAMENMVKKCVDAHQELTVNATHIYRSRKGMVVDIRVTLAGGVNIPLTVNVLQKQIKQYITSCSGVDVKEVRVMVETNVTASSAHPAKVFEDIPACEAVPEQQAPLAEKTNSRAHESIFKHTEEPAQYAAPAAAQAVVEVAREETATVPLDESVSAIAADGDMVRGQENEASQTVFEQSFEEGKHHEEEND